MTETQAAPANAGTSADGGGGAPSTILCVDDEQSIVSSLRRTFRRHDYRVLTATSGSDALALLEREAADVVISDMRMPEMDGTQFLEQVRKRWPDTVRLLLTGYADIESTIGAINRGEIYRYIAKPWDDDDILTTVRLGLQRKTLEREKRALEALTQRQNGELRELNATLESKVVERTAELSDACAALATANAKLKTNFLTSIKVFSNVIELREGNKYAGHSRRVAELARKLAVKMGVSAAETQDVFIAGLLNDIGKIGLPEAIVNAPVAQLDGDLLEAYRRHPIRGAQLLMPLDDLRNAATILRSHRERFDGSGFPDALAGASIPLGARILAIAKDYDGAQIGMTAHTRMSAAEAAACVAQGRGKLYDPWPVDVFVALINGVEPETSAELWMPTAELAPGMVLTRDLVGFDGALLLAAEHVLDRMLIGRIQEYEATAGKQLAIHVRVDNKR